MILSTQAHLPGPPNTTTEVTMVIQASTCDCGTRKEPTPKQGLLLCTHCDRPCANVDGCTRCRQYARSLAMRVNR